MPFRGKDFKGKLENANKAIHYLSNTRGGYGAFLVRGVGFEPTEAFAMGT